MNTPTQHSATRRGQRGFSFIEILIVMAIIAVLVAGVTVAINIWLRSGPEFATKNTLTKTKILIENWKSTFEMYPPSDVTRIAVVAGAGEKASAPSNQTNAGIEAIWQALHWPGFRPGEEWTETETTNTDDDRLKKAISKASAELTEICDAYGHPLVYFHKDDYIKAFDSGQSYLNGNDEEYEAKPYKKDDGSFWNPNTFQLYSVGVDGEPNTDDDILIWSM